MANLDEGSQSGSDMADFRLLLVATMSVFLLALSTIPVFLSTFSFIADLLLRISVFPLSFSTIPDLYGKSTGFEAFSG